MSRARYLPAQRNRQPAKPPPRPRPPPHPGKATPCPVLHWPALWNHLHIEDFCGFQWRDVDAATPEFPQDLHNTRPRVLSPPNGEWQFHVKSHELIDASLACPPNGAHCPPLLCDERGLPLPGCRTIVPVFRILFNRLSMLPSFQLLSGNSLNSLRAPYCFEV